MVVDYNATSVHTPNAVQSEGLNIYVCIVFCLTWLMISPSKWSMFPLGRPTSSLLGAGLMLVGNAIPFEDAMYIIGANMEVMCLLFGLMIISYFMGKEGLYEKLDYVFLYKCRNAFDLMWRIVLICGVLSAFITNDAVCIFITPLVVRLCRKYSLPGGPFLLALGTSANIGSAATITGNPQNALIAIKGNIGYLDFAKYMTWISLICLGVNLGFLFLVYRRQLVGFTFTRNTVIAESARRSTHDNVQSYVPLTGLNETEHQILDNEDFIDENVTSVSQQQLDLGPNLGRFSKQLCLIAKILTYLACLGVFVAFFVGVSIGLASFAGAMAVLTVQAALLHFDPHDVVTKKIDYGLLLFFSGLFICVESFNRTGYPEIVEFAIFGQLDLASPLGFFVFVIVVVIASNTLSNVPAVLLIAPFIESMPPNLAFGYWIVSAWVTTVAGNLTIIGSAANIIVAERASSEQFYDMGFWEFFKFGSWTTPIIIALGCFPLYFLLIVQQ